MMSAVCGRRCATNSGVAIIYLDCAGCWLQLQPFGNVVGSSLDCVTARKRKETKLKPIEL